MLFSSGINPSDPYALNITSLTRKSAYFQSPTIHSARVRTIVFPDGTNYGKLHKSANKRDRPTQALKHINLEKAERAFAAQNWRKDLTENIREEALEKGLRDYLGISHSLRPKTALGDNAGNLSERAVTAARIKRPVLGKSSSKKVLTQSSMERTLRKDLMCTPEGFNTNDFTDEKRDDKFKHITFTKAPSKANSKLNQAVSSIFNNSQVRLSTYDVTLVPSDSRRIVVEAIMRDFFLNLIPENSDYLICKNSQNQIYTIVFTGKLVPTCKACSTCTRFEISKDLGFQVLCNSPYCDVKTLYMIRLNGKVSECLWPVTKTSDIEVSLPLKESGKRPVISKIIQSGKYKITDFSRVMTESTYSATSPRGTNERPMTTANVMRISTSREKFSHLALKTYQTERSHRRDEDERPNTMQELRRLTSLRPGTSGLRPSTSGSSDVRDFKGAPVLREFDDKGMFSREKGEKTDRGVIEQVSEEVSRNEEDKEIVRQKNLKQQEKKTIRGKIFLSERPLVKKTIKNNDIGKLSEISMPFEKKNVFGSPEMDNSLEDIHNMVNILNKGK